MKRYGILLCILCLAVYMVSPAALAESLFNLLDPPAATQSLEPAQISGLFGAETASDSQALFTALETPEPTPFPTPVPRAEARDSKKSGDFTFRVLPDGSAEIIAYKGKDKTLSIPAELKKYPVSAIGVSAFANAKKLKEVEIPKSVTSIGDWGFGGCQNLMMVVLPEGLTTIGSFAFADCPALSMILIPSSVDEIGEGLLERAQPGEVLTIEVCKGSYAEQYFQNLGYNLSFYTPAIPSPTPTTIPEPRPSYTNPPAPTYTPSPSYFEPYSLYEIEHDCPTCLGLGGCPDHCLYGEEFCPSPYCSFGRCTECSNGVKRTYDYHGGIKETPCRKCNGGKCKKCDGTGRIPCRTCNGTGRCPTCGK